MRTDTELRCDGMKALAQLLGIVEAERFVALIQREPFDYTEWRQGLFEGRWMFFLKMPGNIAKIWRNKSRNFCALQAVRLRQNKIRKRIQKKGLSQ